MLLPCTKIKTERNDCKKHFLNDWQCLTDDTFRLHRIKGFLNSWPHLIITFVVMKDERHILTMFGWNHQSWTNHWPGQSTKRHQILVNGEKRGKEFISDVSWDKIDWKQPIKKVFCQKIPSFDWVPDYKKNIFGDFSRLVGGTCVIVCS